MGAGAIILSAGQIIGALALFLFGIKYLSEALQKLSGEKLRHALSSFTSNRFKAALTGVVVTATILSSTASTVMTINFVNAGILNLTNAIGVIMGANIGTSVTAWIITVFGVKYDITTLTLPIIGIGFILMFLKQKQIKHIGECLIGFGLLFLGFVYLKNGIGSLDLANNEAFIEFTKGFIVDGSVSYNTILLCVLIGTIATIILQSSSAMMAITIVLCCENVIPFEMGVALVLGENIGTTFTTNIASAIGNIQAKRTARSHLIFNIFGAVWVLIFFRLIISIIAKLTFSIENQSPLTEACVMPFGLALFHTLFNTVNALILIWFIPQIEKLSGFIVKRKALDEDEVFKLEYISTRFVELGEIAVDPAKKEIQVYAGRVCRMYEFVPQLMDIKDKKTYHLLLERLERYELISDRMEIEIANFLTRISSSNITAETSVRIRTMLTIIDNIESIADQNFQLAKMIDEKNEKKIWLSPEMRDNLKKMFDLVRNALQIMNKNLNEHYSMVEITAALEAENLINEYRNKLRFQHLEDLKNNVYSYETGIYYSGIYALLEKIGDFVINITEAIVNAKHTKDNTISRTLTTKEEES